MKKMRNFNRSTSSNKLLCGSRNKKISPKQIFYNSISSVTITVDNWNNHNNGYAGALGVAIDKFQLY